jgi:hypothetical protein
LTSPCGEYLIKMDYANAIDPAIGFITPAKHVGANRFF